MKIACLGWGSLIWDPQALPIQKSWFKDGPLLPIEFARQSRGDRITLVIVPEVRAVRTLWTFMTVSDLDTAREELAWREGIVSENISRDIGHFSVTGSSHGQLANVVGQWASSLGLDAVVWTNLPPKFQDEERVPTVEEIISFLQTLPTEAKRRAEEYVRKAPLQIDTAYRRQIERELNWTPITIE